MFIKIIVDWHKVVRNNTETSMYTLFIFSPKTAFYKTITVQYDNEDNDIDPIH